MKHRNSKTLPGLARRTTDNDRAHSHAYSRRAFIETVVGGAMSCSWAMTLLGASRESDCPSQSLRLAAAGGDRATGYVMSNKIVRRDSHAVCTWLDVERQNRWALIDLARGEILRTDAIGERCRDNHCGATLATGTAGTLHLLIGAHHGRFVHYRWLPDKQNWEPVEDGDAVGESATYPSLVCDRHDTLHLLYRRETNGRDPHLVYCRRPKNGPWSKPRLLVRLAVDEHSWLTNAIEVGPSGRLHAVVSNTLPVPDRAADARYFGASHLYSDNSGETWHQFGNSEPLILPAAAGQLHRIEGDALDQERIESHYGGPRGPLHSYYHKMTLSNPVVDEQGRLWVIVHNLLTGDAQLYRHEEDGTWIGTPLADPLRTLLPGFQIRHCGQLSRHRDGTVEAVLMVSPTAEVGWGAEGTSLVRLEFDGAGHLVDRALVRTPEPTLPHWLPSLERWCWHAPIDRPALLYTRGVNAGGYSNNVNRVKTEVWVDQPCDKSKDG